MPGFSQPTEDGNGWTYSAAVINILQEYKKTFPWLWALLLKADGDGPGARKKCMVPCAEEILGLVHLITGYCLADAMPSLMCASHVKCPALRIKAV